MSSDDGFDDLSFPEIPPDVWASIHKYETSTPNEPNGLNDLMDSEFDGFNELENALLSPQFHPLPLGKDHDDPTTAQEEEDRLEAELWDEYPELTHEDWAQLHSDILFGSDSDSKRDMEDFASKYRKFISVTEVSALIW